VLDDGGTEQPASAAMRHQMFQRLEPDSDDRLRSAIDTFGNASLLARDAKIGRQTISDSWQAERSN
jgi:hypothetical protein